MINDSPTKKRKEIKTRTRTCVRKIESKGMEGGEETLRARVSEARRANERLHLIL